MYRTVAEITLPRMLPIPPSTTNTRILMEVVKLNLDAMKKVKEDNKELPAHDLGSHWYDSIKLKESDSKKGKKKETPAFDKMAADYFAAYVESAKTAPACGGAAKKEKASVYVEGLLSNGGPSTDIFKKHYGEEKTAHLFRSILFGTK